MSHLPIPMVAKVVRRLGEVRRQQVLRGPHEEEGYAQEQCLRVVVAFRLRGEGRPVVLRALVGIGIAQGGQVAVQGRDVAGRRPAGAQPQRGQRRQDGRQGGSETSDRRQRRRRRRRMAAGGARRRHRRQRRRQQRPVFHLHARVPLLRPRRRRGGGGGPLPPDVVLPPGRPAEDRAGGAGRRSAAAAAAARRRGEAVRRRRRAGSADAVAPPAPVGRLRGELRRGEVVVRRRRVAEARRQQPRQRPDGQARRRGRGRCGAIANVVDVRRREGRGGGVRAGGIARYCHRIGMVHAKCKKMRTVTASPK